MNSQGEKREGKGVEEIEEWTDAVRSWDLEMFQCFFFFFYFDYFDYFDYI